MTLSAKDFEFKLTDTITLAGCPLGDDDYFIMYGHEWSDEDIISTARTYLSEVGSYTETEVDELLEGSLSLWGVCRQTAGVLTYGDEWALTFTEGHAAPSTVKVTFLRLQ